MMNIDFRLAESKEDFLQGRSLFEIYAKTLGIDLAFQGFNAELENIATHYAKPSGALFLALNEGMAIACAALRPLEDKTAELKRMFVLPTYRSHHIGRKLLFLCLNHAAICGYKFLRLDTLPQMDRAQSLYRSVGFYEIEAYRFNPVPGTRFMELNLGDITRDDLWSAPPHT